MYNFTYHLASGLRQATNMLGKFETFAIFNACAGIGGSIDPLIMALITQMRSVYGF